MPEAVPSTPDAVQETVRQALTDGTPLGIFGRATKSHLGRRVEDLSPLDMSGLNEVVEYNPAEAILVAGPGLSLRAAEELVAGGNHHLAFEPPHWGADATLGGTVACNLSGPRRFKAGALRDHILGLEMIDGYGQRIRAGGRVVKNVTGYDLPKVLSGSFGTLGVLTEVCLKLSPRPETQQTLAVHGQAPAPALELMLELAARPNEITGLAYLPPRGPESARTVARIEGPAPAVTAQMAELAADISGERSTLDESESDRLWKGLRELEPFRPEPGEQLWRFAIPPSEAANLLEALAPRDARLGAMDWAGGLVWALFPRETPAAALHQIAGAYQGAAWRFATGPDDPNPDAFSPLPSGAARLNRMVRQAFDPKGIFNPGRIV